MKAVIMVAIRSAMSSDAQHLPAVEQSSGEAFRQIPELAWIADDDVQSVERHLKLIECGAAWIAEAYDQQIVGFLNAERIGKALHIWQMAVHSDHQQKGIGRALVRTAKAWSTKQGIDLLTLTTFRDIVWNEPFYRSCGFQRVDTNIPALMQSILDAEARAGLPIEMRCIMLCSLHSEQTSAQANSEL